MGMRLQIWKIEWSTISFTLFAPLIFAGSFQASCWIRAYAGCDASPVVLNCLFFCLPLAGLALTGLYGFIATLCGLEISRKNAGLGGISLASLIIPAWPTWFRSALSGCGQDYGWFDFWPVLTSVVTTLIMIPGNLFNVPPGVLLVALSIILIFFGLILLALWSGASLARGRAGTALRGVHRKSVHFFSHRPKYVLGTSCVLLLFCLWLVSPTVIAAARVEGAVEFALDDVTLSTTREPLVPLRTSLGGLLRKEPEVVAPLPPVIAPQTHALVDSIYRAWSQHYPLTLTPDIIWLTVVQGLAEHVESKSEILRTKLVAHAGTREIRIKRRDFVDSIELNPWHETFPMFAEEIKKLTQNSIHTLITAPFSTSDTTAQLAFQIALMDTVSPYFRYTVDAKCGIPRIRLEGTVADWEDLHRRVRALREYGLDTWIDQLEPLIEEFVSSARGEVNLDFWRGILKARERRESAGCVTVHSMIIDGWIVKFFPKLSALPAQDLRQFPMGIATVDVLFEGPQRTEELQYLSGFGGIEQHPITGALKPVIVWAVRRKIQMQSRSPIGSS